LSGVNTKLNPFVREIDEEFKKCSSMSWASLRKDLVMNKNSGNDAEQTKKGEEEEPLHKQRPNRFFFLIEWKAFLFISRAGD